MLDTNDMYCVMGQDTDTNQAWVVIDHSGDSVLSLNDAHKLAAKKLGALGPAWESLGYTYKVFKLVPWTEVK